MNKVAAITVFAIDAKGREKLVKAEQLRLLMADGTELHVLLDSPDGVLIGTPAEESAPARLLVRPASANAVSIAVECNEQENAELVLGELDLTVQYADKPKGTPNRKLFRAWTEAALEAGLNASITVRVVDESEARSLNREFRAKDYATNVLTFAFNEGEAMPGMEDVVTGDLVLCADVVQREAFEQGKNLEAHWAHLVVHGVLHLQGYDHEDEIEAEAMEALETAILASLGYPDPYLSEKGAPDA
ncbi:rRNA maturation RNase YbeY [Chitinimonas sp. BJB300]|uniref:rRNA maturation RNase YbeY n=1 Tax=Chitinimonas sp. BJB300 TaxID=1559339 RepID=UPI000C100A8E|nr:rRNA maturation RNase YbeY [Chitinimonas sp. BJB300]PHV11997.1 rRNA maturation RNase YbeY [Chitinimonas sp. BJB300]TSJ91440.1 rRNA maturation RNase YbeY [Chitinimonas sp. BJB300]